jgi:hypothetical protein
MLLARWLKSKKLSHPEAALLFEVSKSYIGLLVNSRNTPGLAAAARIEKATAGKIPCRAWTEKL